MTETDDWMSTIDPGVDTVTYLTPDDPDLNQTVIPLELISPDHGSIYGDLDRYLWMYLSPLIFVMGVVGNALSFAVMRRYKFQGTTTAVYLPVLAVADTAVLIMGITEWMDYCNFITFKEIHPWTCKMEKFLFYTSADTAIWILVLFTFDRFIAVCFPLQKRAVCVPRRAYLACLVVLIVSITKNMHVFWTRGPQYRDDGELKKICGRPYPFTHFEVYIRPWIAFTLVTAIPFMIIIVCNVMIIRTMLAVRRMRSENSSSDSGFLQTTTMCLSASFAFLLFVAPSIVLLIGKPYWSDDNPQHNPPYHMAKAVNNQLVYLNHSINFLLYCFTGAKFRHELKALFLCHPDDARAHALSYYNKGVFASKANATRVISSGSGTGTKITDVGPSTSNTPDLSRAGMGSNHGKCKA